MQVTETENSQGYFQHSLSIIMQTLLILQSLEIKAKIFILIYLQLVSKHDYMTFKAGTKECFH